MTPIELFSHWYEQEKDCNAKMLSWLFTVPEEKRRDPKFNYAVLLAAHLIACRESWLDRMLNCGRKRVNMWPKREKLENLPERYRRTEEAWTAFLTALTDETLPADFEYVYGLGEWRWNVQGQTMSLVGHSFYHRGQIALLVDLLGGKTTDTDYLFWRYPQEPKRWGSLPRPQ